MQELFSWRKTKAITHFLTHATVFSGSHFSHATQKLGNSNVPYCKTKSPVEIKRCKTPSFYRVYNLMKLKPQKERQFLKFGIWLRHMKTGNRNTPQSPQSVGTHKTCGNMSACFSTVFLVLSNSLVFVNSIEGKVCIRA